MFLVDHYFEQWNSTSMHVKQFEKFKSYRSPSLIVDYFEQWKPTSMHKKQFDKFMSFCGVFLFRMYRNMWNYINLYYVPCFLLSSKRQ